MRAGTRMAVVVACLVAAFLLLAVVDSGGDRSASAAPEDGPSPAETFVPDEPPEERGPVVERDAERGPGELPTVRDVPAQSDVAPGDNDTVSDVELRTEQEIDTSGEIGGSVPETPPTDRIRDVVVLLGVVGLVSATAIGVALWRRP